MLTIHDGMLEDRRVAGNRESPLTENDLDIIDALGDSDLRCYLVIIAGATVFMSASFLLVPLYIMISGIVAFAIAGVTFIVVCLFNNKKKKPPTKGSNLKLTS